MEHTPQISVLMGVYNCADTVEEAVRSILGQTVGDWELIICDDGSGDDTYAVAQKLAAREPRIVLIRNERNLGLAPTLNRCLRMARGTCIARMDGDDICDAHRFAKELAVLEGDPDCAVVSCDMLSFDQDGIYGISRYPEKPDRRDLIERSPFCHAGAMMRREILLELGGYCEADDVRRMEDYDLWFRLYQAGYYGRNIPQALYSMRDDRNAFRRRRFRHRLNSVKLKWRIYRCFRPGIAGFSHVLAPVVKGLLPEKLYLFLRRKKLQRNMQGTMLRAVQKER